jgi:hypothetical protein
MPAEGLALDKMGQYRDRLLQKQSEVLAQQVQRHQQEYLLLVNLVSKYAAPEPKDAPKEDDASGRAGAPRPSSKDPAHSLFGGIRDASRHRDRVLRIIDTSPL